MEIEHRSSGPQIEVPPSGTRGARGRAGFLRKRLLGLAGAMYRRGLGRRLGRLHLLLLTTRGARSGKLRTVPVACFPGERHDEWLVVASFAGRAIHPAWFVNLARNPDEVWIEVGARRLRVAPTSLRGSERDAAWRRIVTLAPNVTEYERMTDRVIPVVRLVAHEG